MLNKSERSAVLDDQGGQEGSEERPSGGGGMEHHRMQVYLVEATYVVHRNVALEISAVDEGDAEAEMLSLIAHESGACEAWFASNSGPPERLVQNAGEVEPELVMVSEADMAG
jgi:hypothetical protein